MTTVRALLQGSPLPRLEAQMLLQHVLHVPRVWLLAHDTDELLAADVDRYLRLQGQRLEGVPMAYLVGRREFMGLDFIVDPRVLIPRPDTELLVETAVQHLSMCAEGTMLDLGTGSGAIAVAVAARLDQVRVYATDASADALAVARHNAAANGVVVQFLCGDWYHALEASSGEGSASLSRPGELALQPVPAKFDLIVSNPPYIASTDPHLEQGDLRFEPVDALTDGEDGLGHIRSLICGAPRWLASGGALWLEHGWDQAGEVRRLLEEAGFNSVQSRRDLAGIERISGGSI